MSWRRMSRPGTFGWLMRQEARLAWRDWLSMMTAGRRRRVRTVALGLAVFIALMHLVAYPMVAHLAATGADADPAMLVAITGVLLLSWSLMVSQAMESVTRAFYTRSDLELILSSPISPRSVFSVRIATMAASTVLMSLLLAAPFIDVLVANGGARWLAGYGVIAAAGCAAVAVAVATTVALFRCIGPRRTRLIAQIIAAIVGAAFVIALQLGAITSYGNLSRLGFLRSDAILARAPSPDSAIYWPALALLGDGTALAIVLVAGVAALVLAILVYAPRFGEHVVAAAGVAAAPRRTHRNRRWRPLTPQHALRRKEWTLLLRDPWLVSQSLMQILYLLPPAFLLWRNIERDADALPIIVPVLVMAAGQLAGGLAWLAVSGEDAPDLIASAPIPADGVVRAKVEAVMGAIAIVLVPFVAAIALLSPFHAMVTALGIVAAAAAATRIQLWFRSQAKRSLFRRRQVSSRTATFAEAFSSITIAATAGLAAAGSIFALGTALAALGVLWGARLISPHRAETPVVIVPALAPAA
jgi:ABC-2 type transport system permease protein